MLFFMNYKYDLHVHTDEISSCGKVGVEKLIVLYKNKGYDGIVLTDHFRQSFFGDFQDWKEGIDKIIEIYTKAKNFGANLNLDVMLGIEVSFAKNEGDFLVYGIDEEFLRNNNFILQGSLSDFNNIVKDRDILIYEAHPFRNKKKEAADPEQVFGIEIYNGNPRHENNNQLAYLEAEKYKLKMISGSDFHQLEDLGKGGIISSERITNSEKLINVLQKGNYKLIGEDLSYVQNKALIQM